MTEAKLTIGHIARSAGVNIETVRYYPRTGGSTAETLPRLSLLHADDRKPGAFHKTAQALGLSLKEVQRLMKLDAKGACTENRSFAASKLALVEKKLVALAKLRDVLKNLVAACDQPHGMSCPIIEQLEREID